MRPNSIKKNNISIEVLVGTCNCVYFIPLKEKI